MSADADLWIFRGDDKQFSLAVLQDGVAKNITGSTLKWIAKRASSDPDAAAVLSKDTPSGITVTSALAGLAVLTLAKADTLTLSNRDQWLYWDLYEVEGNGATHTLLTGRIQIRAHVRAGA